MITTIKRQVTTETHAIKCDLCGFTESEDTAAKLVFGPENWNSIKLTYGPTHVRAEFTKEPMPLEIHACRACSAKMLVKD